MNSTVNLLIMSVFYALPIISFILLVISMKKSNLNFALAAFWCSLIAVVVNYQLAGGEILSNYFNVQHAIIYSINLLLFITATIYLLYLYKAFIKKSHRRVRARPCLAFFITRPIKSLL